MMITCVGDCGVDLYIDKNITLPGGITLNFAVNGRRLMDIDAEIHVITALGYDKNGKIVEEIILKNKLIPHITKIKGNTPIQYIDHDKNGEKIFVRYEEGVLGNFVLGVNEQNILSNSDCVVTPLYTQIEPLFNSVVSCTPRKIMAVDFMDLSDYKKNLIIVNKHINNFNFAFFGLNVSEKELISDIKSLSFEYSDKIFVVTLGDKGSIAFNNKKEYSANPYPVGKVIDSTGAGDAFCAAFISKMIKDFDIGKALDFGNKYASEIVQKLGGI